MDTFITSPWTNGNQNHITGSGFGIRIPIEPYQKIFRRNWKHVVLIIDNNEVHVSITESFWRKCHEIRSKEIGLWLIKYSRNKWPEGLPPEILVKYEGENRFTLNIQGLKT
ncbi:MAG: hypothetical protein ACP5R6_08645 [Chlorobaculum sp.]